ncbi:carboxypeptidase-like regulatory domain-containing protein [Flavobacterium kingsejongi]|uniref:TonB-dependent receptor n=1 Tax=Flavobacterium kingsejongi TaxID=1678728 RepID=A0A2S1LT85_9FLAO|nr:carboxypeptidase-like regulatory domain-containing protein [Flavobacterium kingsejongi]AWG26949.1 hypothetical protein FK004_17775 [Flavobacterium kingsejongi]
MPQILLKISILTGILLLPVISFSQTTFSGTVRDTANVAIPFANISISPENSAAVTAYCTSDDKGNYILTTDKMGNFLLNISALSYKAFSVPVTITTTNQNIKQNAVLKYEAFSLDEVIIENDSPIVVRKDTIVFDAKAFAQGNEQVVEDLLRKIPGLNISSEGVIKIGNQEVEKVMIDGDDFFERGYKILTKNMQSNAIDKIELLQRYSNNRLLKGVEKSDKVALNLTLKEGFKRQWFGNINAGYGLASENRYEVKSNLMNFGKQAKYYFLTNLNNTGMDATGDIDNLIRPYRFGEPGGLGDDQTAYTLLNISASLPDLKPSRTTFNNAELLSLNAIFTISKKMKLKTLGFFNWDENNFYRNGYDTFVLNGDSFTNTENYQMRKKKIIGFGKIEFSYDISTTQMLEYSGKYNNASEKTHTDLLFNNDPTNENLRSKNELMDHKINYTYRLNEHQVMLLSGHYINEKTPQGYAVNRFFYSDLFTPAAAINNIAQNSENKMEYRSLEGHLLHKSENGSLFEFKFGNQYRKDRLLSSFYLKENQAEIAAPEGYQNNSAYLSNDLFANGRYNYKFRRFTIEGNLEFHQLYNKLDNTIESQKETPFFINPKIGVEWQINQKNKIVANYSHTTTNARIFDIYDSYVLTGFRNFSKGTGTFNQLGASSAFLNYTLGDWGDKFFINTVASYTKNNDFFSTNSFINPNYALSEKIIIKDRESFQAATNVDRYLKFMSTNLKLEAGFSKSEYKNIVNDELRKVASRNYNYGAELRSGFRGVFNYHLGTKWLTNSVKTPALNNSFTDNLTFLDLSFIFSSKFNIQIQTERYFFGNLDKNNNRYYFLDLEARYVIKPNKLTIFLSGQNLSNTKTFRNYTVSDISISSTEYRLMERYGLIKLEYCF